MEIYLQVHNKVKVYNEYLAKHDLKREEVMMMGDDIPDYEIMQLSGLKCCPADAAEEIKAIADYVSVKKGGDGAARDIIEQTLKAQGRWLFDPLHKIEVLLQKRAYRAEYLPNIFEIAKNPDEVWLGQEYKDRNKRTDDYYLSNYILIKHYKDVSIAVVGKIENDELVWKTWYPVKDKNKRRGLLIKKKV